VYVAEMPTRPNLLLVTLFVSTLGCASGSDTSLTCGPGTHAIDGACVLDGAILTCGAGTHATDGACVPDGSLTCGAGTHESSGACVPDGAPLTCGAGTHASNGACVPDGSLTCGAGTHASGGACVPDGAPLTCGAGTHESNGTCVPDSPVMLPPPVVTIVTPPADVPLGSDDGFTFRADRDHTWRAELGGQSPGAGVLLDQGTGSAGALVSAHLPGASLPAGESLVRLYVTTAGGEADATATVEMSLHVRGPRKVLLWHYQDPPTGAMMRTTLLQDARIGAVDELTEMLSDPQHTLSELQPYDAVVFYWQGIDLYGAANVGNLLADYLDNGGGVVLWGTPGSGFPSNELPLGRFSSGAYLPVHQASTGTGQMASSGATLGTTLPGSPIMQGVSTLSVVSRPVYTVDSGAVLVASWSDGKPLVVTKGSVVGLGWSLDAGSSALGGDWGVLLGNAVVAVAP
jgi:hypothetical protein